MNKRKVLSIAGVVLAIIGVVASFASDMIQNMTMEDEIREQVKEILAENDVGEEGEKIA